MIKKNTIKSEGRQAIILFADISGFTAMSEKMAAEEVTSVMNDCFSMMGKLVEWNCGTIYKFIGDCMMVVIGIPSSVENAQVRAVNTAIEIRDNLYEFQTRKVIRNRENTQSDSMVFS